VLEKFQKKLRVHQTDAENTLWHHLRDRRFHAWKFRRQHIFENYIVDFVCLEQKLIIEVDGGQHAHQEAYDAQRTRYLESCGFTVMRFWNNDVLTNTEGVLEEILNAPHPPHRLALQDSGRPLPQGER